MVYQLEKRDMAASLFHDWEETILYSCLESVMGEIYADDPDAPRSAMAHLGDFSFFAGKPNRELVLYRTKNCKRENSIMVPQKESWAVLIAGCYGDRAKRATRFAMKKEPDVFEKEKLQAVATALPPGYSIHLINKEIYEICRSTDWSQDLVSQFAEYESYEKLGLGVAVLKDGIPVSGASSYSRYRKGIEIEIDTREDHRREGLAYICGARLILECLEHGLYPSWDAQNRESVALAKKLGYHYAYSYPAFEIRGN